MSFRFGIDVGGTFTDMTSIDEKGEVTVFKTLTTSPNFLEGTLNAIELGAKHYKMTVRELLSRCGALIYGTTIATNAVITGTAAKAGLICTRGFRDILLIRSGGKEDTYRMTRDYPEPYVPRYLTFGVTERMNSEGGVEVPLNTDEVREAVRQLKKWNAQAIGVCLLFSTVNPNHENKVGQIIQEEYPEAFYCLSHQVNPIFREYWRTSSTVINASLAKLVSKEVKALEEALRKRGLAGNLSFVTVAGGQTSGENIMAQPILITSSGPSLDPVAGLYLGNTELGTNNLICIDMGGTTFEVSVITDGTIAISREGKIGDHELGMPAVDLKCLGAGGGSIAWIDAGGALRVGPQSAAAMPGPACYMRGGTEATVTDANLVRGLLNPDYFLGGAMKLSKELAVEAIQGKLAKPTGLPLEEAAALVCATCEQNMIAGMESITMRQGVDPRGYAMVAGGSAAGLHVVPIARALGIKKILIPRFAGGMSAFGGLVSDVKSTFATSLPTDSRRFNYKKVNKVLEDLEARAQGYLDKMGVAPENQRIELRVEAQYPQQVWQIPVPLRNNRINDERELAQLAEDFHTIHERRYFSNDPGQVVQFVTWIVDAIGKPATEFRLKAQSKGAGRDPSKALKEKRRIYLKEAGGFVEAPIYAAERLAYQNTIEGPAVIEEAQTTIGVYPGATAIINQFGNYVIELE